MILNFEMLKFLIVPTNRFTIPSPKEFKKRLFESLRNLNYIESSLIKLLNYFLPSPNHFTNIFFKRTIIIN